MFERYTQILSYVIKLLESTRIIEISKNLLSGMTLGDRTIYRRIFTPNIKPDFMFTKMMASYPKNADEIDSYTCKDSEVIIFRLAHNVQNLYHITPPEFKLPEEKYEILDLARKIMSEHTPEKQEFVDPARMREVFTNIGRDLVEELASYRNVKLTHKEVEELAKILVRYTVGFGVIEALLEDDKIQDITINSPMGLQPIFIVHQDYDYCRTNLIPALRVPATSMVREPSIRNDISPAASGVIIPVRTKSGRVQGLSRCLRNA